MSIVRERNALRYFVYSLLICAALIYGPKPLFGQTADASDKQAQEAQPVSATSSSSHLASEDQQHPPKQSVICGLAHLGQCVKDVAHDQADASEFAPICGSLYAVELSGEMQRS
jgi:hypothetical protein